MPAKELEDLVCLIHCSLRALVRKKEMLVRSMLATRQAWRARCWADPHELSRKGRWMSGRVASVETSTSETFYAMLKPALALTDDRALENQEDDVSQDLTCFSVV